MCTSCSSRFYHAVTPIATGTVFGGQVTANRYSSACHLVLNEFPKRRGSIIPEIWKQHSDWVSEWIKDTASEIDGEQKRALQSILFSIANSNGHPIGLYQALSHVKIGNDKDAINERTKHFDNLIASKKEQLSTIIGLQFVLERIDKTGYMITDEQNVLLNNGWQGIDQHTAGNDLKQLVKKIIRT